MEIDFYLGGLINHAFQDYWLLLQGWLGHESWPTESNQHKLINDLLPRDNGQKETIGAPMILKNPLASWLQHCLCCAEPWQLRILLTVLTFTQSLLGKR